MNRVYEASAAHAAPAKAAEGSDLAMTCAVPPAVLQLSDASCGILSGCIVQGAKSVPEDPSDAETVPASDSLIAALPTES